MEQKRLKDLSREEREELLTCFLLYMVETHVQVLVKEQIEKENAIKKLQDIFPQLRDKE